MILDTNALSAWAEGSVKVEARLRSAERLVVPSIVLSNDIHFDLVEGVERIAFES